MEEEEKRAMWICCPTCDKEKCERDADDCDVKRILMKKKAIKSVVTESEEASVKNDKDSIAAAMLIKAYCYSQKDNCDGCIFNYPRPEIHCGVSHPIHWVLVNEESE